MKCVWEDLHSNHLKHYLLSIFLVCCSQSHYYNVHGFLTAAEYFPATGTTWRRAFPQSVLLEPHGWLCGLWTSERFLNKLCQTLLGNLTLHVPSVKNSCQDNRELEKGLIVIWCLPRIKSQCLEFIFWVPKKMSLCIFIILVLPHDKRILRWLAILLLYGRRKWPGKS